MDEHKDENRGYVIAPIRANVQYPKDAKELAHSVARWWERSPEEDKSDSESINHCVKKISKNKQGSISIVSEKQKLITSNKIIANNAIAA